MFRWVSCPSKEYRFRHPVSYHQFDVLGLHICQHALLHISVVRGSLGHGLRLRGFFHLQAAGYDLTYNTYGLKLSY
jgi:hypothetical protein